MTTVLFWDIDGTLLTTKRAGIRAWELAAKEVLGASADFATLPTAGLPDAAIAARIAISCGVEASQTNVKTILESYERHLPAALGTRDGHPIAGVVPILEALQDRRDVHSFLLTGNTSRGAAAKLAHMGLQRFFPLGGAFSTDLADRNAIARHALRLATQHLGEAPAANQVFVVGDTPHDVTCAQAIGARCIAVATGEYLASELKEAGAWHVLERVPDPAAFLSLLDLEHETRMKDIETYQHDGETLAIVVRRTFHHDGVTFLTPPTFPQQLGFMKHPKGKVIQAHVHQQVRREISATQEVLLVRKGRLRVDLFSAHRETLESFILEEGDLVFLAAGGHGFEALEDLEMFEVKQGPYASDKDKVRFGEVAPQ